MLFSFFLAFLSPRPAPAPLPPEHPAETLYQALALAETGGERNPFIRTRVRPPGGSTAYGPVQITGTLAADFLDRFPHLFDREETWYLQRFVRQAEKFRTYGGQPDLPGYEKRYDYGGTGILDTPYDKWMYKRVALVFIRHLYAEQGSLEQFLVRWRGERDERYLRKVVSALPKDFSKNY